MKLIFCTLMALCLTDVCSAQTNSPIRWQAGAPNTDQITVNGKTVKTLTIDGLTLSLSLSEERLGSDVIYYDKFVVYLYALNLSERRVEVSPDMVTVEAVSVGWIGRDGIAKSLILLKPTAGLEPATC